MVELTSKEDIKSISFDILKDSKSLDVFPTPVNEIVQYSNLVVNHEVNLAHVEDSFFSKAKENFADMLQKVRGFLDRREQIIYLDLAQSVNRQNFVKLHETGHGVLPWQKEIMEFLDNDDTLDPMTEEEFEAEANYFASITLFQQDRFDNEIAKLPLGLETVTHLSKKFGASVHATFRRYVEQSKKRCALLVLKNISKQGDLPICETRNYFASKRFEEDFGNLTWQEKLGYKWVFVQDYYHGRRFKTAGEITLDTINGEIDCNYHFFNNTYNGFVFIFPKGEKVKSRTKYVITGA